MLHLLDFYSHVVVLYVINYTYLYHHIGVLDKYTHSNLVSVRLTTQTVLPGRAPDTD